MKLREKINNLKDFIKKFFEIYPLTMIILFIYTIFFGFIMDFDIISDEWLMKLTGFGVVWIIGVFWVENFDKLGKISKIIGKIITAIISAVFVWLGTVIKDDNHAYILTKVLISYILSLCAFSLYFIIKKSKREIPEYILKVFINFTKVTFVYGILALGILCVYEVFNFLILDSKGEFLDNLEILLLGFYYFPKMIYACIDLEDEVNKFFKGLVKWVLMSLITISFVIIYIYIAKIIILRDLPKNQIFRILTALFVVGLPVWTCMQYFKDDSISYKISLKLPFAFIPFIFLQIYTIGIRIFENGVTPLRYVCVLLVVVEVLYEIFYAIKKEKLQYLILILDFIAIVALLVPGINIDEWSNYSQAKRLKIFKEKTNYSEEDKEKIYGAYDYLHYSVNGDKIIEEILTDDEIKEIKSFKENYSEYDDYEYFNFANEDKIDIKDYNSLISVVSDVYNDRYNSFNYTGVDGINLSDIEFLNQGEKVVKVDCTKYFEKVLKIYKETGKDYDKTINYIVENPEFVINNDSKIVITELRFRYNENKDVVTSISCRGYYLEK